MRVLHLFSSVLLLARASGASSLLAPQQQQPLHSVEDTPDKHLLEHVIDTSPLLSLHRDLVKFESISGNEQDVGDFVIQYLQARGFAVEKQVVEPGRFNIYAYPEASSVPPRVLLSSHIDTVPPYIPYSVDLPPSSVLPSRKHEIENGNDNGSWRDNILISGRGSVDAKASVAAQIISVLEYLQHQPSAPVGLLFVVGEEVDGIGMQHFSQSALNTSPPTFHTVIFGEPTELSLVAGHKGSLFFKVHAKGKAAHSGYPWLGHSAFSDLLPVLVKLEKLGDIPVDEGGIPGSAKLGKSTLNIGRVEAGIASNVVPEFAEASVNIRLAYDDVEKVKEIVTKAVLEATADNDEGANVRIEWGNNGTGHKPIDFDTDVDGFNVTTVNYATDAWYLKLHKGAGGSPVGRVHRYLYGPGSIFVAHGADEAITVGDLEAAVTGYKKLIDAAFERNA